MPDPGRILDANANRAREALRVLEDAARFLLEDAALAESAKQARHELTSALSLLGDLTRFRDAAGDVGRTIVTDGESERADVLAVTRAAGSRLGEALRSLEEYAKIEDPAVAARIEQLRYQGYELDRRIRAGLRRPVPQWRVCVLLTESLCRHDWRDVARSVIAAGVDAIQLREKSLPAAELLDRARWLVEAAGDETAIVVNDRIDVALAAGAAGVHLGQDDLPCRAARQIAGDRLLIGISTFSLEEARAAHRDGADLCGVGPMFETTTKVKEHLAGPEALARYVEWGGLPHLAIGGITPERLPALVAAGGCGIAVSSAVCAAEDPGAVVEACQAQLAGGPAESPAALS